MITYQSELLFTLALVAGVVLITFVSKRAIKRFARMGDIDMNKRKVIFYLNYFVIYFLAGTILALIWGVRLQDFVVFMSSIFAVLGVGFVAQWSILSNITASVILFFNHPLRLGDKIRIFEKDYEITGEVIDISAFYLFMKTEDGRSISIPTNLVFQRGIEIIGIQHTTESLHSGEIAAKQDTEN